MTDIARDFPDIARRAKDLRDGKLPDLSGYKRHCGACKDAGWVSVNRKHGGSAFEECAMCRNSGHKPHPMAGFPFYAGP